MSVGNRLKDERLRLKRSQTEFATLAGVKKGTQINWEKGTSSPTADALVAYSQVGADVLYILTGKRSPDRPDNVGNRIEDQLDKIERDLKAPTAIYPEHTEEEAERLTIEAATNQLSSILKFDTGSMTPETAQRASELLRIVSSPEQLSLLRAADFARHRRTRDRIKSELIEYIDGAPFSPSGEVIAQIVIMAQEYGVPVYLLANLFWDIAIEATGQSKYSSGD